MFVFDRMIYNLKVILSETSQALGLPSANTTITVRFRDTKEVYKMLWHGKEEKKYLGGKGWQSFLGNHGFKKGHRLKLTVLDPKKLEFEVASYITLPKRKGKCSAPTINDQKEDDEVDGGGRGRGEPYHLEEKVKLVIYALSYVIVEMYEIELLMVVVGFNSLKLCVFLRL